MPGGEEFEDDMARLREQVAIASADAAAARTLAAGADRDVSEVRAELRAHTRGLSALRETQLEQGRAIADLRTEIHGLRTEVHGRISGLAPRDSSAVSSGKAPAHS